MVHRVVDVLTHLHKAFAAACELVIEWVSKTRQLLLWNQVMPGVAHVLESAVIEVRPHAATNHKATGLLEKSKLIREPFSKLIPLGISVGSLNFGASLGALLRHIHHVCDPGGDGFDQHLR